MIKFFLRRRMFDAGVDSTEEADKDGEKEQGDEKTDKPLYRKKTEKSA